MNETPSTTKVSDIDFFIMESKAHAERIFKENPHISGLNFKKTGFPIEELIASKSEVEALNYMKYEGHLSLCKLSFVSGHLVIIHVCSGPVSETDAIVSIYPPVTA